MEWWPIDRLKPYPRNPRTHSDAQIAQIAASVTEFGFTNPILVDENGMIIAGHARHLAARDLGYPAVPVIVLGYLTEVQKRALRIADNQIALNAGWDELLLEAELALAQQEDFDVSIIGFEDADLARLLSAQDATDYLTDEDAVPELPQTPISKTGDRWSLGPHWVLVGDATDTEAVSKLMAGELADLVFTDPPYNCNVTGYTKARLTIQNDDLSDAQFNDLLVASLNNYRPIMKVSASLYICHSSSYQREFQNALEGAGFTVRGQIIWAKNTFAWGFGRYKYQHEPLFYCHVTGEKDSWYGNRSQSTLWQENKPAANRLHPTMKPVELVERALVNSSKTGDIVADLFAGSGSTLIACERRGRRARLMEIDPRYADCIIRRYQEFTGNLAWLDGDGRTFAEITVQRSQDTV